MCTLTYLPTGKDSFILTTNRDESKVRPAKPPAFEELENQKLLYPKDMLAGGTWVCLSNRNRVVCLLNGAFERHEWRPPYRKSRGLVLLDFFKYRQAKQFAEKYDLEGIEPFTLVICEYGELMEFRWDGAQKHFKSMKADQPHIWSSASLYPKEIREKREQWFEAWLEDHDVYKQEQVLYFHRHGGEGDKENDFVMNRYNMVQTVSITSIVKEPGRARVAYFDLIDDKNSSETLVELEESQQHQEAS